jgi:hypothetical protein
VESGPRSGESSAPEQEFALSLTATAHLNVTGEARAAFGQVVADNGFRVMAYDVPSTGGRTPLGAAAASTTTRENGATPTTEPFSISVCGETVEEAVQHAPS